MKQQFLEWEAKYWFTPYVYALVLYLLMTGMLINAKIIASSVGVYFALSIRVTPLFLLNTLVLQSQSLEISQKNPQGTHPLIQCGGCSSRDLCSMLWVKLACLCRPTTTPSASPAPSTTSDQS